VSTRAGDNSLETCYSNESFMHEGKPHPAETAIDPDDLPSSATGVTQLLFAWRAGDENALPVLIEAVYAELRRIAKGCLAAERPGHTLQATALVNEAYLRLVDVRHLDWQNRTHFFSMAARVMRRILVDHARSRRSPIHGGDLQQVDFEKALLFSSGSDIPLTCLDDALTALAAIDSRKAQVVEMRYFGGLNAQEIAHVLHVSHQTVTNDWLFSKAWLNREMNHKEQSGAPALG
jgi:RNA polymerase sigma factor (TIGR02999 family)